MPFKAREPNVFNSRWAKGGLGNQNLTIYSADLGKLGATGVLIVVDGCPWWMVTLENKMPMILKANT